MGARADAVVETRADGADVEEILAGLAARPGLVERIGHRNALGALRAHDWAHRWQALLHIAGVVSRPALAQRLGRLQRLAEAGEARAVNA